MMFGGKMTPQSSMVYNGKPLLKWMIWGYHYSRKHPYDTMIEQSKGRDFTNPYHACMVYFPIHFG